MPGRGGAGSAGMRTALPDKFPPFPGWLNAWAVLLPLLGTQPAAFVFEFSFWRTCNDEQ